MNQKLQAVTSSSRLLWPFTRHLTDAMWYVTHCTAVLTQFVVTTAALNYCCPSSLVTHVICTVWVKLMLCTSVFRHRRKGTNMD